MNALRTSILFLMLYLIFAREITVGQFFSLWIYSFFIFGPLQELGNVINVYREAEEQPPRDLRAAAVRDPQSDGLQGIRRALLGNHRQRRPGSDLLEGRRRRTMLLRLYGARRPVRSRRRHDRPVGGGRVPPVCAGDRPARAPALQRRVPRDDQHLRVQVQLQSHFQDENRGGKGWISKGYYGLDQGPIVMMIENHRSGFLWDLMRGCPYIGAGLRRAGFTGGWLSETSRPGLQRTARGPLMLRP